MTENGFDFSQIIKPRKSTLSVPYIPITKETPSRFPLYTAAPILTGIGLRPGKLDRFGDPGREY